MGVSDDEQPHDPIRKRDVDPTDSERLQLYWYSQKHSKETQKELSLWFYTKFKKQINYQLRNTHHQTTVKSFFSLP